MRKKVFVFLLILALLCSISPVSLASGYGDDGKGTAKIGPERAQAIEKLKQMSDGDLILDQDGGQVFLSGKLSDKQQVGSASAVQFLNAYKSLFGMDDATKELRKQKTIKGAAGDTVIRFDQLIDGIPVEGNTLNVHFGRDGSIVSVNGNYQKDKTITKLGAGTITDADAVETAKKQFTYDSLRDTPSAQRVILTKDGKNYDTYKVNISYTEPDFGNYDVYVEAHTGKVVDTESNIRYDGNATGTGVDVTGVTRNLNLWYNVNSSSYWMEDFVRLANGIRTYDVQHTTTTNGPIVSSASTSFNSENYKASVSAHCFAGKVIDFYKQLFNRNSLDGNGMAIKSYTHYDTNYNNAFWDGYEMVYGDGDGTEFTYLSGDLDVVGHEMTHGVISNTADLNYHNEPGALNESLADTFGVLIETYDKYNVGSGGTWTFEPADWVIGDQIYTPGTPNDALRSLADPTLYGQPDNMLDYMNLPDNYFGDYGGVHENSGIPNKAAFLIAQNVGMQETAQIYYAALTKYMIPSTNFVGAKDCLVQAATDLYGAGSSEVSAINSAFLAVGVGAPPFNDPYEPNDTFDTAYQIEPGTTYQSYISSSSDSDYYKFNVGYTGNIHLSLSNLPDTYILYLYGPDHSFIDDVISWDLSPVSLDYTVTTPGTYYAIVEGFYSCYSRSQMYSLSVTPPGAPVAVTGVSLDQHTLNMAAGAGSTTLVPTISPASATNKTVTWSSNHPEIATVNSAGTVTPVGKGNATITATTADGGFTDACQVTVTQPVTGVSLDKHTVSLPVNGTAALVATVTPSDADDKGVIWYSSDNSIASVDDSGNVTAVSLGSTSIIVMTNNCLFWDYCYVTVAKPVTGVTLDRHTASMHMWDMLQLIATVAPSDASDKDVTWTSSNNSILQVGYGGFVTAMGAGTATITATTDDGQFTDSCVITVAQPATGVSLDRHSAILYPGDAIALTATVSPGDAANKDVVWSSGDPWIASVSSSGVVNVGINVFDGFVTITARTADGVFADKCTIHVKAMDFPIFTLTSNSFNSVKIDITPVDGASGYEISRYKQFGAPTVIATTTSTTYVDSGLTCGESYFYSIRAYRDGATRTYGYTNTYYAIPVPSAPAVTAAVAYNSVRLSWGTVSGVSDYEIYRSTSPTGAYTYLGHGAATGYTDTGVKTGTTYYYKVHGIHWSGTSGFFSDYSAIVSARPAPAAPASVKAVAASYNSVKITWGAVGGVTKYEVYRSTAISGKYTLVGTTSSRYLTNSGVMTGTTYYYQVRAYRLVGKTKAYSDYSAIGSATANLSTPSSLKAARANATGIKLSWKSVSGASGYEVWCATSPTGEYTNIKSLTGKSFTNTGLQAGNTYYYEVRAYRTVSGRKVYSAFSAAVKAHT